VIAKKYGTKLHSVQPNFDARAMNEIGFTRDHDWSVDTTEFCETYDQAETHELTAAAEGEVQGDAEDSLLRSLQDQLVALSNAAADGVVLVLSEQGVDYPKTRHTQTTRVVEGANRLYFRFTIEPPLRVAVYRKRA
jgi:chromosome condensin MukBEF complex kleisin-like MukF subunit